MQIILEPDEAWSIMTLVVSQVLDQVELSDEGKNAIRKWRGERNEGTAEVSDLAVLLNETLGTVPGPRAKEIDVSPVHEIDVFNDQRRAGYFVKVEEGTIVVRPCLLGHKLFSAHSALNAPIA